MKKLPSSVTGSSLKKFVFIAVCSGVLASCASKQAQDDAPLEPSVVQEPDVVTTPIEQAPTEVLEQPVAAPLETVFYFEFDQSTLRSATRAALDAQASALRSSGRSIRLEGHADERGTREYN
ncbi:MAG: OmpA family protein, partial [Pseudomonadales bacterium]|nr:OmpA family protein [Gammaproteobacteria bacterium]NNL57663.1 OmpA family protein [Pseudomonadales bacterium]